MRAAHEKIYPCEICLDQVTSVTRGKRLFFGPIFWALAFLLYRPAVSDLYCLGRSSTHEGLGVLKQFYIGKWRSKNSLLVSEIFWPWKKLGFSGFAPNIKCYLCVLSISFPLSITCLQLNHGPSHSCMSNQKYARYQSY